MYFFPYRNGYGQSVTCSRPFSTSRLWSVECPNWRGPSAKWNSSFLVTLLNCSSRPGDRCQNWPTQTERLALIQAQHKHGAWPAFWRYSIVSLSSLKFQVRFIKPTCVNLLESQQWANQKGENISICLVIFSMWIILKILLSLYYFFKLPFYY